MTRTVILAKARTIFGRRGYAEVSLREIAEAVGIKTPSLYAHFASKQALFEAVYAEVVAEHAAYFDELVRTSSSLTPLARLHHLLAGIERYYHDRRDLAEFSLRATVNESGTEGENLRRMLLDSEQILTAAIQTTYADGVADGTFPDSDSEGFTSLVLLVMDGLFLQLTHYTEDVYRRRFEHTWSYLSRMLTQKPRQPRHIPGSEI